MGNVQWVVQLGSIAGLFLGLGLLLGYIVFVIRQRRTLDLIARREADLAWRECRLAQRAQRYRLTDTEVMVAVPGIPAPPYYSPAHRVSRSPLATRPMTYEPSSVSTIDVVRLREPVAVT